MLDVAYPERPQLRMVWPVDRLGEPPEVIIPDGYLLRLFDPGRDGARMVELMRAVGWKQWEEGKLGEVLQVTLPRGWFVVVHEGSDQIVASAEALHNYKGNTPFWGNLGWVGCDPEHRGKALGTTVTAAVVGRLIEMGYERIDLYTEYYRPAAIRTYLKMGWVPAVQDEERAEMWRGCCGEVGWPFALEEWHARAS